MDETRGTDPFTAEALRIAGLLADVVRDRNVSVRSLEKKMGVAESMFAKVLKGKITLQLRHVVMICTALGVEWQDFFAHAYQSVPLTDTEKIRRVAAAMLVDLGVVPEDQIQRYLGSPHQQEAGGVPQARRELAPDQEAEGALDNDAQVAAGEAESRDRG
jgi:transcriptional regulator with XRE-family HTH domain